MNEERMTYLTPGGCLESFGTTWKPPVSASLKLKAPAERQLRSGLAERVCAVLLPLRWS